MLPCTYRNIFQGCLLLCIVSASLYVHKQWVQRKELMHWKNARTGEEHQHSAQERHGTDSKTNGESTTVQEPRENARMKQKQPTATNKPKIYSNRYLLPVKPNPSGGANHQYRRFKKAIIMSVLTNRTLVMTPFFLSGGHVNGYTREHLRPFNVTFDADILSQVVPVAKIEAFKKVCNRNNTKVILWAGERKKYENIKKLIYTDMVEVDLPSEDEVINLEQTQLDKVASITANESCVALSIDGLMYIKFNNTEQTGQIEYLVDKYLVPAPNVVHIVNDLTKKICKGNQYLAYHWRNQSGEICFFGHERHENDCASQRKVIRKFAEISAEAVTNLMKSEQIECIYLACPLWALEMVDILSKRIPRASIFTSGDILGSPKYKTLLKDYYTLSLVEQEISMRGAVFVATTHSSWSKFVMANRVANGRTNYDIKDMVKRLHDIPPALLR
ncbi:uncharacterized protein [Ptychodera flava]|uniref:uncharacterized protein n=1 Tax=Ptychodera flava TaxID=63121 RepID=UPI00396A3E24